MLGMQICYDRVDVWAHPSLAHSLEGFCGNYNFYVQDDSTERSGKVHKLSPWAEETFAISWRVSIRLPQTNCV